MRARQRVPARRVLIEAEATNERLGHENLGFLSASHGFLPKEHPVGALPASHRPWDDVAARLPELFRTLALRSTLDSMPLLGAGEEELPDRYLLRAAVILGIFAHAYHYVQTEPPEAIPPAVTAPWAQVSRRLRRPAPHLSFIDMNAYNWRVLDAAAPDTIRVENLALLIAVVGNEDERRFQMMPVEALAVMAPTTGAAVRAQEAVVADDVAALKRELVLVADAMHALARVSFPKVNPNRYSATYVDPVVWGKTVAPIATPYDPGVPGPSGTAIPSFQLLDVFLGRRAYATAIGHETDRARGWFPPHWQRFLAALEVVSVPEYVERNGDRVLRGLFREALEAYAGDTGVLGRHRLKTYGYLDLSFKAGRTKTLGGFGGGFSDRIWDRTDGELEQARRERYATPAPAWHHVTVKGGRPLSDDARGWVGHLTLDVGDTGIRWAPGSRCAVLAENRAELVERTLRSLRARGDEVIELDAAWRQAIEARDGYEGARVLTLRSLLRFGRIRPVERGVAKLLLSITHDDWLHRVVERRAEDQWELCELLGVLAGRGYNPRQLWKAHAGEPESVCRVVPPQRPRLYSISSAMEAAGPEGPRQIELTFARLRYDTDASDVSAAGTCLGTASGFLSEAVASSHEQRVSIKIVRASRFALPEDHSRPIVMFAGGTGLAPFRALLQERRRQVGAGESWLFFATRTHADLYHADELAELVQEGALQLRVAFSREDVRLARDASVRRDGRIAVERGPRQRIGAEMLRDDNARRLWQLMRDEQAVVYVCGRAGFADAVMEAILAIAARFGEGSTREREASARELLRRMVGEDRYLQEIYTTYTGPAGTAKRTFDASEVVVRNNDRDGYWIIISGRVYDLTEFSEMHPGGQKIIRSYAGMDATLPYRKVQHDANPEVDAMLAMHELGVVRRLDFGSAWRVAICDGGLRLVTAKDLYRAWIGLLYAVVEMENAVANDFGVRVEPVTHDETSAAPRQSPYKTQLLLQAHQRFLRDYLAAVTGPPLERLWALTAAADGAHHDAGWMRATVAELRASEQARAVALLGERIDSAIRDGTDLPSCVACCARIEAEDRRCLHEMKSALQRGLRVFERWEAKCLSRGAGELIAAVTALPAILERYQASVAGLATELPPSLAAELSQKG